MATVKFLPIMVDPAAPGRLGEDGLNENVQLFFTILARGGLVQLIIFIYFHLKLFLLFKSKFKNSFVLILILPAMFNAFLDVAMESVQFQFLYYVLLGYMLSTKDNSNINLANQIVIIISVMKSSFYNWNYRARWLLSF